MGLTVTALTSEMTDSQKIEFYARYTDKKKNALIAIILAVFLGTFGIHKFYQGKITWGIIYILFCWTGIPTIWSIVEAVTMIPWTKAHNMLLAGDIARSVKVKRARYVDNHHGEKITVETCIDKESCENREKVDQINENLELTQSLVVATDEFGEKEYFDYTLYLYYLSGLCIRSELYESRKNRPESDDYVVNLFRSAPRTVKNVLDIQCLYREFVYRLDLAGGILALGLSGFERVVLKECLDEWDKLDSELSTNGMTMMPSEYWRHYQRLMVLTKGKIKSEYFHTDDPELASMPEISYVSEYVRRFLPNSSRVIEKMVNNPSYRHKFIVSIALLITPFIIAAVVAHIAFGNTSFWLGVMLALFFVFLYTTGYFDS